MARDETRLQLILTAERLFATKGIERTSLREINLAAGQRNTAAAHYHFGSKEALLAAIFQYRRPPIQRLRAQMLDRLEAEGRAHELRALVESTVYPFAEQLDPQVGGGHSLLFMEQLQQNPPPSIRELLAKHGENVIRTRRLLVKALAHLPEELVFQRLRLMTRHMVVALADYQRHMNRRQGAGPQLLPLPLYLSSLVDSMVAYLDGPPSESTLAELAKLGLQSA